MLTTKTETNIKNFKINYLTKEQYETALTAGEINQDELYMTPAEIIPTKTSELINDSGFKTTDNDTTYSLSKSGSLITLTGSDGSTSSVVSSNINVDSALSSTSTNPVQNKIITNALNNKLNAPTNTGTFGQVPMYQEDGTILWSDINETVVTDDGNGNVTLTVINLSSLTSAEGSEF